MRGSSSEEYTLHLTRKEAEILKSIVAYSDESFLNGLGLGEMWSAVNAWKLGVIGLPVRIVIREAK
jgi:hypothetical protein